jgi:F-type H+-transporting ATPase subunit delta
MNHSRVNIRYAKALLQFAEEKSVSDAVFEDVKTIFNALRASRELHTVMQSPVISKSKKSAAFHAVFKSSLHEVTLHFVDILIRKNREHLLEGISFSAIEQFKIQRGIFTAAVTSAAPLTDELREKIQHAARQQAPEAKAIELVETVDTNLVGGYVFVMNHKKIDASLRGRIQNLKRKFDSNPFIKEF